MILEKLINIIREESNYNAIIIQLLEDGLYNKSETMNKISKILVILAPVTISLDSKSHELDCKKS